MISEEKQNLIRARLIQGVSYEEIAREVKVSVSTVKRYKKNTPGLVVGDVDTGDDQIQYENTTLCTKMEEKYLDRLDIDVELYIDYEEGWVFHYDKENYITRTSGLWWSGIAYPESVTSDWIEQLERLGIEVAISPLHDKDVWDHDSPRCVNRKTGEVHEKGERYKAGDRKKAHWHFIVKFNKSTSFKEANNVIRKITRGPYLQKCRSLKHAYDYFTHNTEEAKRKGKYRYDSSEITRLNDFRVEPNRSEIGLLQCEIAHDVMDNNLETMIAVAEHYKDQPEIMAILWAKPGFITSLVRALYLRNHPEAKVKLTYGMTKAEYKAFTRDGVNPCDDTV